MESLNILDDILSKSRGYEVALLTTYNFEIPFFERNILNRLEYNNIRRFGLFVDSKTYVDAINSIENSSIGKKYIVSEVDIKNSFHPKIILLLGEKKARLIVSSANLTFTGYYYNNEIFNVFDYDENTSDYLSLIKEAYSYFSNLNKLYNKLDNDVFNRIKEYNYLYRSGEDSNVKFISNYSDSIMNQVNHLNIDVKQIDIAVPFYDNELNTLKKIKELYPSAKINLYVQNKFSTFNFELNNKEQVIPNENIHVFCGFNEIGTPAIYHGKVFRFNTDSESYVLYGSANCTEAALMKSSIKGGNYECDILAKGSIDEFNYFFDNFISVDGNEKISNRGILYNNIKKYNYKHIATNDSNSIHIRYKEIWNNLEIYINDKKYKFEYEDDEIIIELNDDVPYGIFKIDFVAKDNRESINAFLIYKNVIDEYRNSTSRDLSVTLDKINNSKSSEYIKYYKMLLNLVPYDNESLREVKENKDIYNEAVNQKEADDEFDDEFIVDFDIPDEVLNKQREYNKIESIKKGIISNFTVKILSGRKNVMHGRNLWEEENENQNDESFRISIPLPEEEKFSRYIKRLFKSILDIKYLEDSSLKNYIDNILLLINVIYTYNDENSTSVFDINEYNGLLLNFFEIIQKQDFSNLDDNTLYILKVLLFTVLLQVSQDKENQNKAKIEISCRNILLSYDRKFNLKNDYQDILESAIDFINLNLSFEEEKGIIEKYFNYKNEDELYSLIKEKIKGEVSIDRRNNTLIVNAYTTEIGKYMSSQNIIIIFNEVKNRYRQTKEVDTLLINIMNNNIDAKLPNPIEAVKYVYNINSSIVEKQFKNKNDIDYRIVDSERI